MFADLHLVGRGALTAQYILVVDALNFCFWPEADLEYDNLARGIKVLADAVSILSCSVHNLRESRCRFIFSAGFLAKS